MDESKSIKEKIYFSQLNGLRCIAVLMTMAAHWPGAVGLPNIPYSSNGVDIFFVISGFLITLLLFKEYENKSRSRIKIVRDFMMRRVLRLFPLYYLYVFFFYVAYKVFNLYFWFPGIGPYLLTYTSNIYYYYRGGHPGDGIFNHTWSLAVEEQFYIIWPWVIVFLKPYVSAIVVCCLIFISLGSYIFPSLFSYIPFPPVRHFNTLGAGALLAFLGYYKADSRVYLLILKHQLALAITCLLVYVTVIVFCSDSFYFKFMIQVCLCLTCFFIVFNTVTGWNGFFGKLLSSRPFAFIGKISYGVYLFHEPMPSLFTVCNKKLFPDFDINPFIKISIFLFTTILLAALSYRFIETPFLKLKRNFR